MDETLIKNEFVRCLDDMPPEYMRKAISSFDRILRKYDFCPKETALTNVAWSTPELVDVYIKLERASNRPKGSVDNYAGILRAFFLTVQKDPKFVTSFDIIGYLLQYQEQRNVSPETVNNIRKVLHSFYSWAAASGYVPGNPVMLVKKLNEEKKKRAYLTDEELELLRSVCNNSRERALIEVMASTACRIAEICGILLKDIDWNTWSISVLGKGNKRRNVKLTARAQMAVRAYLNEKEKVPDRSGGSALISVRSACCAPQPDSYLFATVRGVPRRMTTQALRDEFDRIVSRVTFASGKKVTPHTMRHTWATLALKKGMPLEQVSQYLGHAQLSTTMIYVELDDTEIQRNVQKYAI